MKKNQDNGDRRVGLFREWPVQNSVVLEENPERVEIPKNIKPKGKALSKRRGKLNPYQQGRNRE